MDIISWPQLCKVGGEEKINITSSPYSIGRGLNCNTVIASKLVSRVHCIFTKSENGWILTDKSTNGTIVNGTILRGTSSDVLKHEDVIVLTAEPFVYNFYPSGQTQPNEDITDELLCNLADKVESETKRKSDEGTGTTKKVKVNEVVESESLQSHMDTVEDELTCSICSELFIKAVTLNCSHSFCKYCIEMWQKNKSICPICRAKIVKMNPTLVLDNFIGKVLEKANDEVKERRKKMIAERQAEEQEVVNSRSGNSRNPVVRITDPSATIVQNEPVVIELSDNETDEEDQDEDGDSSYFDDDSEFEIEMQDWEDQYLHDDWFTIRTGGYSRGGAYYGGYGACYTCGERGHWANGCPNRNRRRN